MTTTASTTRPARFRRLGAIGSALAVAFLGVGALSPETASAAGVATGPRIAAPADAEAALADPAAVPTSGRTSVRYVYGAGRGLERLG